MCRFLVVLITDGGPYLGAHELSVEIGHIPVRGTEKCPCGGVGCLETVASAAAIERHYLTRTGRAVSAREIAADPDPEAVRIWRSAARSLADGLAVAVALLDPALIVIGGGVAEAGSQYLDLIGTFLLDAYHLGTPPPLRAALLGDRAAVAGAGQLALTMPDRAVEAV